MYVVALAEVEGAAEHDAQRLADDLQLTAFETRLLMARDRPTVVQRTPQKSRAIELMQRLQGRGHTVVALDTNAAPSRSSMTRPRKIDFEATALVDGDGNRLDYADVRIILRGSQPQRTETTTKTTKRKLNIATAVATGGLKMRSKVKKETRSIAEDREQLLYIFTRDATPWLLEEHGLQYQCLGAEMSSVHMENFLRVVQRIREQAPVAQFDERLVKFAKAGDPTTGPQAIDEQAYLIALCLSKGLLAS